MKPVVVSPAERLALRQAASWMPDSVQRRSIAAQLERMREAFVRMILRELESPGDTKGQMERAYREAVLLGSSLAGVNRVVLVPSENRAVRHLATSQHLYFARFRKADEGKAARAALYGGAVDTSFWIGWLSALPPGARIYWRLTPAEHCRGGLNCPNLADQSPYSLDGDKPIPTVPKAGDTSCLGNCKCFLEARGGDFVAGLLGPSEVEVLAIGAILVQAGQPEARAAAAKYQGQYDMMERGARNLTLGVAAGASLMAQAEAAANALADMNGERYRFGRTVEEMQRPINQALSMGAVRIAPDDVDDDLVGLLAVVVKRHDELDRGRITAVSPAEGTVTLNGSVYNTATDFVFAEE